MEFISYASEYDLYVGRVGIGDLPPSEQDELIRSILGATDNFREFVVRKQVKKSQAEGLWTLVVVAGLALEQARRVNSFEERGGGEVQEIVSFFSGTKLWLRLEEAFPPFDVRPEKTNYDWSELERVRMEHLTEATGQPLVSVMSKVCKFLASTPLEINAPVVDRMPYHAFKQLYDEGKLILFVDRGLSTVVGRARMVRHPLLSILPIAFFAGLVAFVPIWVFFGFWYGLLALSLVPISRSVTIRLLVKETRKLALADKNAYRWLISRRIIWLRYVLTAS